MIRKPRLRPSRPREVTPTGTSLVLDVEKAEIDPRQTPRRRLRICGDRHLCPSRSAGRLSGEPSGTKWRACSPLPCGKRGRKTGDHLSPMKRSRIEGDGSGLLPGLANQIYGKSILMQIFHRWELASVEVDRSRPGCERIPAWKDSPKFAANSRKELPGSNLFPFVAV